MGRIDNVDSPIANTTTNTTGANTTKQSTSWHHDEYISDNNNNSTSHTILDDVTTTKGDIETEHWFVAYWRPCLCWLYFVMIAFDFILAPIFTFWFAYASEQAYHQWNPLTLQGGGLIHVSLGAIIGIYTWARTKEKLAGVPASFGVKPTTA